ncbi:hypothetical protein Fot_20548 [Forsythia ovata]|uniref:Uncharacterized protein n=1 Tax=Forsythia ovata TaxID=205694 RepID=A0ABD1USM4_9LAMI
MSEINSAVNPYPIACGFRLLPILCCPSTNQEMEDQRMLPKDNAMISKPRKKKPSTREAAMFQELRSLVNHKGQKIFKRGAANDISPLFQQEKLNSDLMLDSSSSGNQYRALRRKYLLLEDENFGLGTELKDVEDEIKALEHEKLVLLDELVVLEGLVDRSDLQPQGQRLS